MDDVRKLIRFDLKINSTVDCYCGVEADKTGDYVLFEDYQALQAKVKELEAELKTIRDIISACNSAEEMTKRLDKKYPALLEAEIEFMKSHWINPTGED
jgi:hypothetical protein